MATIYTAEDAPAWAFGESSLTPKGTYDGDSDVTIRSYAMSAARSNLTISTGARTVYVENADMSSVFEGMRAARGTVQVQHRTRLGATYEAIDRALAARGASAPTAAGTGNS